MSLVQGVDNINIEWKTVKRSVILHDKLKNVPIN